MNDIHIILDIDQTLLDSMSKKTWFLERKNVRPPDYFLPEMVVWERKGLREFMQYLDKNVKYLSIWTNGSKSWLMFVVDKILSKYISRKRFTMLLSVEYSVDRSIGGSLPVLVKDIELVIKKLNNSRITMNNTILIDDNPYNCIYNKGNTIPVKKFLITLEDKEKKRSQTFYYIMQIIDIIKKSKDIRMTLTNVYNSLDNYEKLFG